MQQASKKKVLFCMSHRNLPRRQGAARSSANWLKGAVYPEVPLLCGMKPGTPVFTTGFSRWRV